ncbi:MAG: M1 family metallopeptidase [Gemmatimonadota bacterium]
MNSGTWSVILLSLLSPQQEFHQEVDYRIEARLDESTHVLTGRGRMRYTNRSPDAIDKLFFHLHLNAFRPNSAWATRELQFDTRRFQDLGPAGHAYDRVAAIRAGGRPVTPVFPFAPDSTVMAVPLPATLKPGATVVVDMDWTSRLATVPRRQGRAGRHYDWAHWYPRIAVYDTAGWQVQPLLPQGEFHGEFASYDVTLDVMQDQVLAATGVPVSGEPGWQGASQNKQSPPLLRRDAYAPRAPVSLALLGEPRPDRKRVRWRAEDVIHFAWITDPAFVYEGSRLGDVALHALYVPGDTLWPDAVIEEMKQSIIFFDSILGPYVYPQMTSARRIERGGTEFPMIMMNGANPPVNHEVAHQWAHALLANNEFEQGWLDEGFASFLGMMYAESKGGTPRVPVESIARLDSAGVSQPSALPAAEFRDFNMYQLMTYTKPSLVFRMLRWHLGDQAFRSGLKLYYQRNRLEHVDENDFRQAMEAAADTDLDWFFQQWLHTTGTLDYAITATETQQTNGQWRTRVEITRTGENWMPVELEVGGVRTRIATRDRVYHAFVNTRDKPNLAVLDPDHILIDSARANNTRAVD